MWTEQSCDIYSEQKRVITAWFSSRVGFKIIYKYIRNVSVT